MSSPSFREALGVWFKIGCLGFGGPAGQIALLHKEVVDRRGWIGDDRFQHALSFCMLLPGPEAQQLATYIGWLLHGVRGGLAAGLLFVLPGLAVIVALSALYVRFGAAPEAQAVLLGLKAAVVALVVEALLRIARRSLKTRAAVVTAILALAAMLLAGAPFPLVVLTAGIAGALLRAGASVPEESAPAPKVGHRRTAATVLLWAAVWLVPVALVFAALGPEYSAGPLRVEAPVLASLSPAALLLVGLGCACVFLFRRGVFTTLGVCIAAALALQLFGGL